MGERVSRLRPAQVDGTKARSAPVVARRAREVGATNDPAEREADRIADLVVAATAPSSVAMPALESDATRIRRSSLTVASDVDPSGASTSRMAAATGLAAIGGGATRIRRATGAAAPRIRRVAAVVGAEGGALDDTTASRIRRAATGGSRLDPVARDRLSCALDTDVSGVRLHTGSESTRLNEQLQAKAFTMGRDIFFRDGIPDAGTPSGMHLLAHEVAHTVQPRRRRRRRSSPSTASPAPSARRAG